MSDRKYNKIRQLIGTLLMGEDDPLVAIYLQEALLKLEQAQERAATT